METVHGKLTNRETKEILDFSLNPTAFQLVRNFQFDSTPRLGKPAPLVTFRSGGVTSLTFQLVFDKDADKKVESSKIFSFLKGLNKVHEEKRSVPVVEFTLGKFCFPGYVTNYTLSPQRFDAKANPVSLKLDLSLLSNGEFENAES